MDRSNGGHQPDQRYILPPSSSFDVHSHPGYPTSMNHPTSFDPRSQQSHMRHPSVSGQDQLPYGGGQPFLSSVTSPPGQFLRHGQFSPVSSGSAILMGQTLKRKASEQIHPAGFNGSRPPPPVSERSTQRQREVDPSSYASGEEDDVEGEGEGDDDDGDGEGDNGSGDGGSGSNGAESSRMGAAGGSGTRGRANGRTKVKVEGDTGTGSGRTKKDGQPKRGARACVNCRKGKNRCEGGEPCRRCKQHKLSCIYEKTMGKTGGNASANKAAWGAEVDHRMNHIESHVSTLASSQTQMQTTLTQILAAISHGNGNGSSSGSNIPSTRSLHGGSSNGDHASPLTKIPTPRTGTIFMPAAHASGTMAGPSSTSNAFDLPPIGSGPVDAFSPRTGEFLSRMAGHVGGNGTDSHFTMDHTPTPQQLSQSMNTGQPFIPEPQPGNLPRLSELNNGAIFDVPISTSISNGFAQPEPLNRPNGRNRQYSGRSDDRSLANQAPRRSASPGKRSSPPKYPKLPGFKPPPHRFAQYGLVVPSTAASSDDESEDTLPRSHLNAPIEALQALANAADSVAHENAVLGASSGTPGFLSPPRVLQNQLKLKKRKHAEPTPSNAFPDVVTKGLVQEKDARELWDIFFSGCHYFTPVFDRSYDVFHEFMHRTPFSFDGILAVAAKIKAGSGQLGPIYQIALEEAQGIARSTLFGPVVRKEAVMAMVILAAWAQNGYLPTGHALRMAVDMHLHKALAKLADGSGTLSGKARSEAEERDLVVSARIWLNVYLNDHILSLGTGQPLMLRDDESVRNARLLLSHSMASETDVRLIACVELLSHKTRVHETLHPLHGRVDSATVDFVRRVMNDLLLWHSEWRAIHLRRHDEESVLVKLLDAELYYAQLWTACVALRGCSWDKLEVDQRELAFQAKDAAIKCLTTYKAPSMRTHLKYAVHETMVQASFSAVFLLKVAILFPQELPPAMIGNQVSELAEILSECAAGRYALTLRLMLRSFRRKMGEATMAPGTPRHAGMNGMSSMTPGGLQSLLTMDGGPLVDDFAFMDDLGPFNWPENGFSPSNLPAWITETNVTDLGMPEFGSDSIFLPPELANMFLPAPSNWLFADSADAGAEAW